MNVFADAWLLGRKDLLVELRSRASLVAAITTAWAVALVLGLAVGPEPTTLRQSAPLIIWTALILAGLSAADHLDRIDRRDDAFSAIWLTVADRRAIFLGRVLAHTVALAVLQASLWLLAVIILDLPLGPAALALLPLLVAGSLALAATTVLATAIAGASPMRTLLLPLVALPLVVPVVLAGIRATDALLFGTLEAAAGWGVLMAAACALFLGIGILAYESVIDPED